MGLEQFETRQSTESQATQKKEELGEAIVESVEEYFRGMDEDESICFDIDDGKVYGDLDDLVEQVAILGATVADKT